jgi:G protein-coupled receptor GPR1
MHRQLRYLFIYPLVYILMWLIPFVAHIARYQSGYYRHPSYVLDALTVVSTSSQAAVDCLVFIFVEQPWKHIPGSDGTFLGSFACVRIRERRRRGAGLRWADGEGPMTMQEARNAERRRAERRRKKEEEGNRLRRLKSLQQPSEHYWWEQYGDLESEHGGSTSARDKQSSRQESHRERNDLEQGGNGDTNKAHRDENRAGDEGG